MAAFNQSTSIGLISQFLGHQLIAQQNQIDLEPGQGQFGTRARVIQSQVKAELEPGQG